MIFLILPLAAIVAVIVYDLIKWKEADFETFLNCLLAGVISLLVALGIWLGVACLTLRLILCLPKPVRFLLWQIMHDTPAVYPVPFSWCSPE